MILGHGRACNGEVALVLRPREARGTLIHQLKGAPAKVWVSDPALLPEGTGPGPASVGDTPRTPNTDLGASEAVRLIKRLKADPPKRGPATLRGNWKGELRCDDQRPVVALERKIASYGVLRAWSDPDGRWSARFERAERWFGGAAQKTSGPHDTLAEAIQAGMGQAIGLVKEACSFRDTRRRNTVDADYAAAHPYQPPREPKDPTERYNPKARYRAVEGGAGWEVQDEAGRVIAAFGAREKGKATKHASALSRGQIPPMPAPQASASPAVADAFGLRGMPGLSVVPALKDVPAPEPPACPVSVAKIAAATEKEAEALEDLSGSLWGSTEAPELLSRAAKLIRHAESLVRSPLCQGAEQKAAWGELKKAADAYNAAREALGRGDGAEVVKDLKVVVDKVALAAARAAKACAGGTGGGGGKRRTPEPAPAPAEPKKRGRKGKEPEADAAKDAILMDAFAKAIQQAAAQMQAGGGA